MAVRGANPKRPQPGARAVAPWGQATLGARQSCPLRPRGGRGGLGPGRLPQAKARFASAHGRDEQACAACNMQGRCAHDGWGGRARTGSEQFSHLLRWVHPGRRRGDSGFRSNPIRPSSRSSTASARPRLLPRPSSRVAPGPGSRPRLTPSPGSRPWPARSRLTLATPSSCPAPARIRRTIPTRTPPRPRLAPG
jgi:hypothetical protein